MTGQTTLDLVGLFVGLVGVGALVALVARRLGLPDSVVLVVLGLAIGAVAPAEQFTITPELVLAVLVPGLVFEAAYRLDVAELRRTFLGAALLAVPGVLISAGTVALILSTFADVPIGPAFIVGAIVSATDPVAVIATFRHLDAPRRLATLVEAESLFNDGTAVVVFTIAVQAISHGVTPAEAISTFLATVVVSAVIGLGLGVLATRVMNTTEDQAIELTISLVLAYGTYLVADQVHASGIIATVVAGIVLGTYGRRIGMPVRTFDALDATWEFIAFLLTALVFLLIGTAITLGQLREAAAAIAWGVAAILIGRMIAVYLLLGLAARALHAIRRGPGLRTSWLHVLFWAGLRGAIAVALALSLPDDLPDRARLQGIAFGITLFTLLVQGTTTDLLLRRLRVSDDGNGRRPTAGRNAESNRPEPAG
jgi:monovalent cation:H+ antiporter, CPA1 family